MSPSLKGGGEGGRRGGEGSPGAPSLVARPESGEGWVAFDCLGGGRLIRPRLFCDLQVEATLELLGLELLLPRMQMENAVA